MSLRKRLEQKYDLQITQWQDNLDVIRVTTKRHGTLCLKPFEYPPEEVQFIADVQIHLEKRGFPFSPRVMPTRHGRYWFQFRHKRYILTNWIEGKSPCHSEVRLLKRSARTLAKFHRYAEQAEGLAIPTGRHRIYGLPQRFAEAKDCIQAQRQHIVAAKVFQSLCDEAIRHVSHASAVRAIAAEAAAGSLVHGDFNYPNLIVDKHGHHQMIDFENTSHYVRMEDLAHLIHRNYPWQIEGAKRLIDAYQRVRHISQGDVRLLVSLLYEPYPLIRILHQHRLSPLKDLPSAQILEQYADGLDKLLQ